MAETTRSETAGGGLFRLGAALGLLGVGLGAFGAHGLAGALEGLDAAAAQERLCWWETAAHYHLLHAVSICAIAAALGPRGRGAVLAQALGVVVFSGTLYAMGLGGPRWLGAITPIGGVALMIGWGLAAGRAGARSATGPADDQ